MLVPAAMEDLDEPHVRVRPSAGPAGSWRRTCPASARRGRTCRARAAARRQMSVSSGTDVCMRNAISYCAMRACVSGSPTSRNVRSFKCASESSMRRRVAALTPGGIRQKQHRVALGCATPHPGACWAETPIPTVDCTAPGPPCGRSRWRQHDERRQVLVQRAQSVTQPGPQAGAARQLVAGADVGDRRIMVDRFGVQALDDREIVDHLGRVRQQLADPGAVAAVLLELVFRRGDGKPLLAGGHRRQPLALPHRFGQVLVEQLVHLRLVVEHIQLAGRTGHEQIDGPLGLAARNEAVRAVRRPVSLRASSAKLRSRQQRRQRRRCPIPVMLAQRNGGV